MPYGSREVHFRCRAGALVDSCLWKMPSAEVKQENMASENTDPFHKAMTYLKFKIKNMEQRKVSTNGVRAGRDVRHNGLVLRVSLSASTCG